MIHEELRTLLPPLSAEESAGLEKRILTDGCLSPLIVWNNVLVDGHHRYEICSKHQIPFAVRNIDLDDLNDAKLWRLRHQCHRRNLNAHQRGEIALEFKDIIVKKAKERQRLAGVPNVNAPVALSETKNTVKDESGMLCWHKDTFPSEWAVFFMETYSVAYVRDLIHSLLNQYHDHSGKEATQQFLLKSCAQFID